MPSCKVAVTERRRLDLRVTQACKRAIDKVPWTERAVVLKSVVAAEGAVILTQVRDTDTSRAASVALKRTLFVGGQLDELSGRFKQCNAAGRATQVHKGFCPAGPPE